MAQRWLARSIFDVQGIQTIEDAENNPNVRLLNIQYRMVPAISEIVNNFVYEGRLQDHPSTRERSELNDGITKSRLALLDTTETNAWCSKISTGGRFNLYHALSSATLAKKIVETNPQYEVGIITPYTRQARLINKIIKDWGVLPNVRVSNAHKFQGGEEQIIIFDTTEGMGVKTAPMLDDAQDNDARRLLNVVITRARDKFYLIANTRHLLQDLSGDSLLAKIVRHFQEKAETISPERVVDNYFVTEFDRLASDLLSIDEPNAHPVSGPQSCGLLSPHRIHSARVGVDSTAGPDREGVTSFRP